MPEGYLLQVLQEGLYLVLLISLPPLLAAMAAGVVTGLLQASTRVWDPAIALAPRVAAVLLALVLAGPWIGGQLVSFSRLVWQGISGIQ